MTNIPEIIIHVGVEKVNPLGRFYKHPQGDIRVALIEFNPNPNNLIDIGLLVAIYD